MAPTRWFSGWRESNKKGQLSRSGVKNHRLVDSFECPTFVDNEDDDMGERGEINISLEIYGPEVKQDKLCYEVLKLLNENNTNMVAIYGVRGIGKSYWLKKLESEALASGKFSLVIHVISPDTGIIEEQIMNDICHKLKVKWGTRDNQLRAIYSKLQQHQPFLMLFDDIVEPTKFRVPAGIDGKFVFTTREIRVVRDMNCLSLQVAPLDVEEAWNLFNRELGSNSSVISNHEEMKFAERMVEECGGIPLSLKVLAGAIKRRSNLESLIECAKELYNPIKLFSFILDSLPSNATRECFLYTAMLPKNRSISERHLIEYWIAEGFMPNVGYNLMGEIKEGQDVMESLKIANLLEESQIPGRVKMVDSLRCIALHCNNHEILVESGGLFNLPPDSKKWSLAKRASLMSTSVTELKEAPRCHKLQTLLITDSLYLRTLPTNFFCYMPLVKVLDLSRTILYELPASIGTMVALKYLNLTSSSIRSLPKELKELKKLKFFILEKTFNISSIPEGLLSNFVQLQLFNIIDSGFALCEENNTIIQEMKRLNDLEMVGIGTTDFKSFEKLSNSKEMARKLIRADIRDLYGRIESVDFLSYFGSMKLLKEVRLSSFKLLKEIIIDAQSSSFSEENQTLPSLESLLVFDHPYLQRFKVKLIPPYCFENLRTIRISSCPLLVDDISWLQCLPNLINIFIEENKSMSKLFKERIEECESCFPKLRRLSLQKLSFLKEIGESIVFPSLEVLVVAHCPELNKLPNDLFSQNLKEIDCSEEWWSKLSLDDTIRASFQPKFIS